jgi:parallel beta-helix repeat protein
MTFTGNTASNNGGDGVYFYSSGSYINVSSNTIKSNNGEGLANDQASGIVNVNSNIVTGNRLDICDDAGPAVWSTFSGNTWSSGGKTTDCDLP